MDSMSVEGAPGGENWQTRCEQASFSVRHYFMASPALRQLGGGRSEIC